MSLRQAESLIGSDLQIVAGLTAVPCDARNSEGCTFPYLDEKKMTDFLESQKTAYGYPVIDYAFVTKSLKSTLKAVGAGGNYASLEPACEYTDINPFILGVPENYMKVVYDENYTPVEFQSGVSAATTSTGEKDAISMLYNDDETWSPATTDYNNIIVTHYGS